MKINLVIHTFYPAIGPGGPITSTLNTTKELANQNLEVFVSTSNCDTSKPLDVEVNKWIQFQDNLYVKYYKETILGKLSLYQLFFLWQDIKKCDVIHIQGIFNISTPLALLYAYILNKPILLSPRGALGEWCVNQNSKVKKMWLKFFIKPFLKKINWHVTAKQEEEEVKKLFNKTNCFIVPNGINFSNQKIRNKKEDKDYLIKKYSQIKNTNKIIICMARLQKIKGLDILIESFAKTIELFPNSILLIAGRDENEKNNLERLVSKLNLEKNIYLIGQIEGEEKEFFFSGADLFVLPSHNENFGNVYAESLSYGTPIVASTNTPWEEVEKEKCGKWVKNTVQDTSEAMNQMLKKDNEEVSKLSKNYIKKFDWKNIASEFKKVYKEIS